MILITGHEGFIGRNLCHRFDNKKYFLSEIKTCINDLHEGIQWKKIKEIWHMGAISDTTETNINAIYKYNIRYTIELFEKAIKHEIPIKYASSASVYGNSNYRREINPLNYYAMSKATIDRYVQDNINKFVKVQGYRFYNVYGKYEDHKGSQASPIHTFTKQAKEQGLIKLFDNSTSYMRDFIWVEDVIDCWLEDKPSGIYDVGTGVARSFERVGEIIAERYNAKITHIPFPEHLKSKYQYFTCAKNEFDKNFTSVEEYISL